MARDELTRMRDEVLGNKAQTARSTERLRKMLDENAEDMKRHDAMLAMIEAELKQSAGISR